jgi:iron complex transport system substrate-binding protein
MKKNPHFAWLSHTFAFLLLASCAGSVDQPSADIRPETPPKRIISVVPSATEMLFAIGMGDSVVAVGDYDHFPPEVETRPRIGGLLNPNIEKIIELGPDLVITYGSQDVLRDILAARGIRLYPLTHGTVETTLQFMIDLGRTVGAETRAREVVEEIRETFEEVKARAPRTSPRVLVIHNRGAGVLGSFYSVGSRAFQHELITMAGGENLFADVDKEIIQPSLEEILSRSPEIIIETLPAGAAAAEIEQRKRDWQSLANLPAAKNDRIYVVAEDYLLVPGPRLDLAARRFGDLIRNK